MAFICVLYASIKKTLLKNINLSLRYYIVLLSLLLLLYYCELKEKICAIRAFLYVSFLNCVDHIGAIIATLSKNDVPFDVGDVVTVLHCLEDKRLCFYTCLKLLFAFMLLVLFWLD